MPTQLRCSRLAVTIANPRCHRDGDWQLAEWSLTTAGASSWDWQLSRNDGASSGPGGPRESHPGAAYLIGQVLGGVGAGGC